MTTLIHDSPDYQVLSRAVPLYMIKNKRTGQVVFETLDIAEALEKAREEDNQ